MLNACRMEPAKHPETVKMCPEQGCRLRLVRRRLLRGISSPESGFRGQRPSLLWEEADHLHAWFEWQDFCCQVIFWMWNWRRLAPRLTSPCPCPEGLARAKLCVLLQKRTLTVYFLFFPLRPLCSRRRGAVRGSPPCISSIGTWRPLLFSLFSLECVFVPPWMNQPGTQRVGLSACLPYPAHKYTV